MFPAEYFRDLDNEYNDVGMTNEIIFWTGKWIRNSVCTCHLDKKWVDTIAAKRHGSNIYYIGTGQEI